MESSGQGMAGAGRSRCGVDVWRRRKSILAGQFCLWGKKYSGEGVLSPGKSMARADENEVRLDWGGFACLTCTCCSSLGWCAGRAD